MIFTEKKHKEHYCPAFRRGIILFLCLFLISSNVSSQALCMGDTVIYEGFDGETFGDLTGWTTVGAQGGTGNWVIDDNLISTVEPLGGPVPSDRLVIRDNSGAINNSSLIESADFGGFVGLEDLMLSFSYVYNDRDDVANPNDYLELYISKFGQTSLYWDGFDWVPGPVAWLQGEDEVDDFFQPIPEVFYMDDNPFKVRFNYQDGSLGGTGGGRGASIDDFTICGSKNCRLYISSVVPTPPLNCDEKGTIKVNLNFEGTSPYDIKLIGDGNPDYNSTISSSTDLISDQNVDVGNYSSLIITDSSGCSGEFAGPFDVDPNPFSNDSLSAQNPTCGEDNGTITASAAGYDYMWSNSANNAMTQTVSNLGPGTYSVTITDVTTSCTTKMNAILTDVGEVQINSINVLSEAGCDESGGLVVDVTSAAVTEYLWSNSKTTALITNLEEETYSVTVSTYDGLCQDTASVVLGAGSELILALETKTDILCAGDATGAISITTNGTGFEFYDYAWSGPDGYSFMVTNHSETITNTGLIAGQYIITVTDAKECVSTLEVILTEPAPLGFSSLLVNDVSCFKGSDGSITATMTGGVAPYTYLWNLGVTTASISGLTEGIYGYTFSDANGCVIWDQVEVEQPEELILSFSSSNVSCYGGNNGTLTAITTGGTPPYSYNWSNGQTTQSMTGLTAGIYELELTDKNGCIIKGLRNITEPDSLYVKFDIDTATCLGVFDGSIVNAEGVDGIPPYDYLWFDGSTSQTISGLTSGTFGLTMTDGNGCILTEDITVGETNPIIIELDEATELACFGDTNGIIEINVSGANGNFSYTWSNGDISEDINGLSEGTYALTVNDFTLGCYKTDSFDIIEPEQLLINLPSIQTVECDKIGEEIWVTAEGGTPTYTWDGGLIDSIAIIPLEGNNTFELKVADMNNCLATATYDVFVPSIAAELVTTPADANLNQTIYTANLEDYYPQANGVEFEWVLTSTLGAVITQGETSSLLNISLDPSYPDVGTTEEYILTITPTKSGACAGEQSIINIKVFPENNGYDDFIGLIPEVITPNEDGQNDEWLVTIPDVDPEWTYMIFNRNGHKVLENERGITQSWDGADVADGVYWVIIYDSSNEDKDIKYRGAITKLSK